ncbi:MAG: hypothetical protein Q8P67_16650 [archaeon]|nr:hypothetical protein [archaeon]
MPSHNSEQSAAVRKRMKGAASMARARGRSAAAKSRRWRAVPQQRESGRDGWVWREREAGVGRPYFCRIYSKVYRL